MSHAVRVERLFPTSPFTNRPRSPLHELRGSSADASASRVEGDRAYRKVYTAPGVFAVTSHSRLLILGLYISIALVSLDSKFSSMETLEDTVIESLLPLRTLSIHPTPSAHLQPHTAARTIMSDTDTIPDIVTMSNTEAIQQALGQRRIFLWFAKNIDTRDLLSLCRADKGIWDAAHSNINHVRLNERFGLPCKINRDIPASYKPSPDRRCLDNPPPHDKFKAKPCVSCSVQVCNHCRYHMVRTRLSRDGVRRFGDEWQLQDELEQPPVLSEDRFWQYQDDRPQHPPQRAHCIISDSLRAYCDEHLEDHKRDLRVLLEPEGLPGPLCICSPLRIFIGQWWCINCLNREYAETQTDKRRRVRDSNFQECAEDRCERQVNPNWKQCSICKHLKEPYVPER
jgi:hypothetical protein